jgi:hypothetical protein
MATECLEIVEIIRKSKKQFTVQLRKDGKDLDLSVNDEITVCFPGESGTPVTVTKGAAEVSILSATNGQIRVEIPAAKTELLNVGEDQTIEVQVVETSGADPDIWQFLESLKVVDSIC